MQTMLPTLQNRGTDVPNSSRQRHRIAWLAMLIGAVIAGGCGGLNDSSRSRLSPPTCLEHGFSDEQLDDGTAASDSADGLKGRPSRRLERNETVRDEIQRISRGSGLVFIAQDFQVLKAKRLKIEQGSDSMGVQHWPGVYRDFATSLQLGMRERGRYS